MTSAPTALRWRRPSTGLRFPPSSTRTRRTISSARRERMREAVIAVAAGLSAMLGWGFADFFAKVTIDRIGSLAALVWAHLTGAVVITTVVVVRDVAASAGPH